MELYIKAGPDGQSVGDCPFAHFVRSVLAYKGVQCQVVPCTQETKPGWLVADHGGKMPCLKNKEDIITESGDIAAYLDKTFPEPAFFAGPQVDQISAKITGIFPALAKFVKTVEFQPELEEKLLSEIETLDKVLGSSQGKFLCCDTITMVDLSLAPKLLHLTTTLAAFSPNTLEKVMKMENFSKYLNTMMSHDAISSCSYPSEVILWGWTQARNK
eukprot:GFUD01028863.1.p1 GENE.GFUD01028863.1~~GFUD01028863.1.p1  ORF type:complete len:215 (-),score=47.98 GFUD01028863.1:288-932(-)